MKKMLIVFVCVILLFSGCTNSSPSCSPSQIDDVPLQKTELFAMDTYMTLKAYCADDMPLDTAKEKITELESLLSVTSPESDIYRINGANGEEVLLNDESAELIKTALGLCERTNGMLDITIYPVLREWGFTSGDYKIPSGEKIRSLLENVDHSKVELSDTYVSMPPNYMIDLGAVAKGYTSDKVISILKESGITSAIVSLGGNIHALGSKPDGSAWKIALTDPASPQNHVGNIEITDKAIVTSGNYERYFTGEDGKRYCHIISPFNGYPVNNGIASVTVIGDSGTLCDALSTAIFVMGKEAAVRHWREHNDFEMIIIEENGDVSVTEGIRNNFSISKTYEKDKPEVICR